MSDAALYAIVPVKRFDGAKSRLSSVLGPVVRAALARAMLEDVLTALSGARRLVGIAVVTQDTEAAALASCYGARVMTEGADQGHTGAVTAAMRHLRAEGCSGILTLPGDLPLLDALEVDRIVAAHGRAPAFTIVSDYDGRGSNAIACSPPGAVELNFGDDSLPLHLAAARRCGIEPQVLNLPGVALDIDRPTDLERLFAHPPTSRAQQLLAPLLLTAATTAGSFARGTE